MKVTGTIVRRRSMGKHLAFAQIQRDQDQDHDQTEDNNDNSKREKDKIIQVSFRRASPSWNKDFDETFPTKASSLPYGAHVEMELYPRQGQTQKPFPRHNTDTETPNSHIDNNNDWEVHKWNIISDPRKIATFHATQIDSQGNKNGILYSKYLKLRADAFFQFHDPSSHPPHPRSIKPSSHFYSHNHSNKSIPASDTDTNPKVVTHPETIHNNIPFSNSINSHKITSFSPHGDKKAKTLRAKIFASWLMDTFGVDSLKPSTQQQSQSSQSNNNVGNNYQKDSGVLDVAGGKGQLSIELAALGQIPCTVIDPLVRKQEGKQFKKQIKRIQKVNGPLPNYICKGFYRHNIIIPTQSLQPSQQKEKGQYKGGENKVDCNMDKSMINLVKQATCVVGLHPDECTEDILDVALLYNKSVAIVPCCVFPSLFPTRQLQVPNTQGSRIVRTYNDFMQYLLEKDERLQVEALPFQGKNQVIYFIAK